MGYTDKLRIQLEDCADAGIITREQAGKIIERITENSATARIKGTTWMALIAGLCFALGISLIIAHNWDTIPALCKVLSFAALFAAVGEAALYFRDRKPLVATSLSFLWFVMPAIGIGLFAQVFQLSGDPIKPYFLWAALSFPLAYSREKKLALFEGILISYVLIAGSYFTGGMLDISGYHDPFLFGRHALPAVSHPYAWPGCFALITLGAWLTFTKLTERQTLMGGVLLAWIVLLPHNATVFGGASDAWLLTLGICAAALLCINIDAQYGSERRSKVPFIIWLACLYVLSFFYKEARHSVVHEITKSGVLLSGALYALAAVTTVVRRTAIFGGDETADKAARWLLIIFTAVPCMAMLGWETSAAVLANIGLLLCSLGLMWSGTVNGKARQINAGVAVLTLLLVTRFLDYFGSMLTSGAAFLGAGAVFSLFAYLLNKGRKTLLENAAQGGGK
jgi:uncharacterized membrane protein